MQTSQPKIRRVVSSHDRHTTMHEWSHLVQFGARWTAGCFMLPWMRLVLSSVRALLKHELKRHIQDFFITDIFCLKKRGLKINLLRSLHSGLEQQEAAWNLWRVPEPLSEPSSPQMRRTWCTPPEWGTGQSPEPTCCHPLQAEHKRMTEQKREGGRERRRTI